MCLGTGSESGGYRAAGRRLRGLHGSQRLGDPPSEAALGRGGGPEMGTKDISVS